MSKSRDTMTLAALLDAPISANEHQYWQSPMYTTSSLTDRTIRARLAIRRNGAMRTAEALIVVPGNVIGLSEGIYDAQDITVWAGLEDAEMLFTRDRAMEQQADDFKKVGELIVPSNRPNFPTHNGGLKLH